MVLLLSESEGYYKYLRRTIGHIFELAALKPLPVSGRSNDKFEVPLAIRKRVIAARGPELESRLSDGSITALVDVKFLWADDNLRVCYDKNKSFNLSKIKQHYAATIIDRRIKNKTICPERIYAKNLCRSLYDVRFYAPILQQLSKAGVLRDNENETYKTYRINDVNKLRKMASSYDPIGLFDLDRTYNLEGHV